MLILAFLKLVYLFIYIVGVMSVPSGLFTYFEPNQLNVG